MQTLIVAVIVMACSTYAAWTLMPAAGRRVIASRLLKLPLPEAIAARMLRAATLPTGCGCDGCDHAPAAKPARQVVTFHPRRPG